MGAFGWKNQAKINVIKNSEWFTLKIKKKAHSQKYSEIAQAKNVFPDLILAPCWLKRERPTVLAIILLSLRFCHSDSV